MPRLNNRYSLRLSDGTSIPLKATSAPAAVSEVLAHFGATIHVEPGQVGDPEAWNRHISEMMRGTPAKRWQVEAIRLIWNMGELRTHRLARLAGTATRESVLKLVRGKHRAMADEIVEILNTRRDE